MKTRHARAVARNRAVAKLLGTVSEDVWQEVFLFLKPNETTAPARAAKALKNAARHDGLWNAFAARAPPRLWIALSGSGWERFRRATILDLEGGSRYMPRMSVPADLDCDLTVVLTITQDDEVIFLARFPYAPRKTPHPAELGPDHLESDMLSLHCGLENEHGMRRLDETVVTPEINKPFVAEVVSPTISPIPDPDFEVTFMIERPDGRVTTLFTMEVADVCHQFCSSTPDSSCFVLGTLYESQIEYSGERFPWRLQIYVVSTFPRGANPTGLVADVRVGVANWTSGDFYYRKASREMFGEHSQFLTQGDVDHVVDINERANDVIPNFRKLMTTFPWI